jgi:hypothetical protein
MLTPRKRRSDVARRARVRRALRNRTSRRLPIAVLTASALVLACCAANGWGGDGLLGLMPALLLALTLLARRYPGERLLLAARVARRSRRPRPRSAAPRRPRLVAAVARGGLLLARSLAVRPPPRVALLS